MCGISYVPFSNAFVDILSRALCIHRYVKSNCWQDLLNSLKSELRLSFICIRRLDCCPLVCLSLRLLAWVLEIWVERLEMYLLLYANMSFLAMCICDPHGDSCHFKPLLLNWERNFIYHILSGPVPDGDWAWNCQPEW